METKLLGPSGVGEAARIIARGGLVAVPTETVYGLACNGLDASAIGKIFAVKSRPETKPISLLVSGAEEIAPLACDLPKAAYILAGKFWPGPLTMVLKAAPGLPPALLAGGDAVGLRAPAHPLTLELIRTLGAPLAAPSANPSGAPSPKSAGGVMEYFSGEIDAVLDGGVCELGRESTVVDLTRAPFEILREGALPEREIFSALRKSLRVIGITGPTGAGKTTALEILRGMGALVIDCDLLYHELLDGRAEMVSEIAGRFPAALRGGKIDRKALGAIVFSNPAGLSCLGNITHKYVSEAIEERLFDWARRGGELCGIDAVALIESGGTRRCEAVVGILAPAESRIERIIAREGISREYALARLRSQKDDAYYIENCGYILRNDGKAEDFAEECRGLFTRLLRE